MTLTFRLSDLLLLYYSWSGYLKLDQKFKDSKTYRGIVKNLMICDNS